METECEPAFSRFVKSLICSSSDIPLPVVCCASYRAFSAHKLSWVGLGQMDEGNERISLGLKESYFPELGDEMEPQSEGEAPDEVIQSNAGTGIKTVDDVMADKDEDIEGDENEKEEDSEEESGETEEGSEDDEESDEADVEPDIMLGSRSLVAPPLEVQLDRDLTSSGAHTKDENEEDVAEEDTEEAKKLNRRAKKRIKEERYFKLCNFPSPQTDGFCHAEFHEEMNPVQTRVSLVQVA